jgi:hypothetical protein
MQLIILNDLEEELKVKNQNTKLDYKINANLSYGFLKNRILELLFKETPLEEVFRFKSKFGENIIVLNGFNICRKFLCYTFTSYEEL